MNATSNLLSTDTLTLDKPKSFIFCYSLTLYNCCCVNRDLTLSQTCPDFYFACSIILLKIAVGKGEVAQNKQFLLFQHRFLPIWRTSVIFIIFKIVVCNLFQFGRV